MKSKFFLIIFAALLVGAGFFAWKQGFRVQNPVVKNASPVPAANAPASVNYSQSQYPEVEEVKPFASDFSRLQEYFQNLAKAKGGRYAFDVLKRFAPGPNIDMHLLGHTVGDELYKQEGVKGMTVCDQDFRNACSHSIVIGLFSDKGEAALPEITEACRRAPGGRGAYTMCFHGLGHGILSAVGYDMLRLAPLCLKTGTAEWGNSEVFECIGGSVMEIVGGGFHDRENWAKQRAVWLDPEKPLALCEQEFIPEFTKFMCYEYITPFLFEAAGGDLGQPTAQDFEKAFKFCEKVPTSQAQNRDACFGGFGKEFDGLVAGRDIRSGAFDKLPEASLKQIYEWCLLAVPKDGKAACVVHALNSLYWGGENNRSVSIRFCRSNEDDYLKRSCFMSLITAVGHYISDVEYHREFCGELPEAFVSECKNRLKVAEAVNQ